MTRSSASGYFLRPLHGLTFFKLTHNLFLAREAGVKHKATGANPCNRNKQNKNPSVIKVYSNEMEAAMAQQVLENSGIQAFVFKDDAGGMEPHLQLTSGVRLVTADADAEQARQIIEAFDTAVPIDELPPES